MLLTEMGSPMQVRIMKVKLSKNHLILSNLSAIADLVGFVKAT